MTEVPETSGGMAIPENSAEAQAASDHSASSGQPGHAESVSEAESSARSLEQKYGLGKNN